LEQNAKELQAAQNILLQNLNDSKALFDGQREEIEELRRNSKEPRILDEAETRLTEITKTVEALQVHLLKTDLTGFS
jgi:hypothetical protein